MKPLERVSQALPGGVPQGIFLKQREDELVSSVQAGLSILENSILIPVVYSFPFQILIALVNSSNNSTRWMGN